MRSTLLAEKRDLDVLAVVLDSLDGAREVVIACHQYCHVVVVLEGVGQHISGQLDISAFFIRRDGRPVDINEASQTQFRVGDGFNAVEKGLLLLIELGFLFLTDPGVIIVNSDKLSLK